MLWRCTFQPRNFPIENFPFGIFQIRTFRFRIIAAEPEPLPYRQPYQGGH